MPVSTLKVPAEIRNLIRRMHPQLKRKVRAALADILEDPGCGKALKEELEGYWSLPIGRTRIIYRPDGGGVEIVAIGPRETIYVDAFRQRSSAIRRSPKYKHGNAGVIHALIIAQRYKAGESIEELAEDYGRSRFDIEEAIRCELWLDAA